MEDPGETFMTGLDEDWTPGAGAPPWVALRPNTELQRIPLAIQAQKPLYKPPPFPYLRISRRTRSPERC